MKLEIRRAESSDLEDIQELNEASWREAYNGTIPEEKLEENAGNYPEERLNEKIEDDELLFLVAESTGKSLVR
ncbi:MAG: hypothetical protein ABEK16_04530 [Candidatus Nanohalobium sp.]